MIIQLSFNQSYPAAALDGWLVEMVALFVSLAYKLCTDSRTYVEVKTAVYLFGSLLLAFAVEQLPCSV